MIRVSCPTGCAGWVRQPFRLRDEVLRCKNCTAYFAAPARVEDGGLAEGVLVARPGERPAVERKVSTHFLFGRSAVAAACVIAAGGLAWMSAAHLDGMWRAAPAACVILAAAGALLSRRARA